VRATAGPRAVLVRETTGSLVGGCGGTGEDEIRPGRGGEVGEVVRDGGGEVGEVVRDGGGAVEAVMRRGRGAGGAGVPRAVGASSASSAFALLFVKRTIDDSTSSGPLVGEVDLRGVATTPGSSGRR